MIDLFSNDSETIYKKVVGDNGLERVREYTKPLNAKTTDERAKRGNVGELAAMRTIILWRLMARLEPAGCVDYRIYQVTESEFNRKEFDLIEEWQMDDGKKYRRLYEVKCERPTLMPSQSFYGKGTKPNPVWLYATNGEALKVDGTGNIMLGNYYLQLRQTEAELDELMREDGYVYQGRYLFDIGYVDKQAGEHVRETVLKTSDETYLTREGFRTNGEALKIASNAEMFTALVVPVKRLFKIVRNIQERRTFGAGQINDKVVQLIIPISALMGIDAHAVPVYGKPSRTGVSMYPVIASGMVYENDPMTDTEVGRITARKRFEYRWTRAGVPFAKADAEELERVALINPVWDVVSRDIVMIEQTKKDIKS